MENKRKLPEYELIKGLKKSAFELLPNYSSSSFSSVYQQFNLAPSNPHQLYKKVELPFRYGKVVFRLIREFKPKVIVNYGPAFGVNLSLMALAYANSAIYQEINDSAYEGFTRQLLKDSKISNIHFFHQYPLPMVVPEFVNVNYPGNPVLTRSVVQKILELHGVDDVLIIRGIHESIEMEVIWQQIIDSDSVHVSLDLFEIGIVLFREGLQKENFIQRF